MNKRALGELKENVAKEYLEKQGLKHIESNYNCRYGEIDLIFIDYKSKTLVFVEVKYRSNSEYGNSLEAITYNKIKKINKTALFYINKICWEENVRYDIIGIDKNDIKWIKNAFEVI